MTDPLLLTIRQALERTPCIRWVGPGKTCDDDNCSRCRALAACDALEARMKELEGALIAWAEALERDAGVAQDVAESFGRDEFDVRREYLADANRNRTIAKRLRELAVLPGLPAEEAMDAS